MSVPGFSQFGEFQFLGTNLHYLTIRRLEVSYVDG